MILSIFSRSLNVNQKGVIAPGMLADLTVIDHDLRSIPPEQIRDAKVLRTLVSGRSVYER